MASASKPSLIVLKVQLHSAVAVRAYLEKAKSEMLMRQKQTEKDFQDLSRITWRAHVKASYFYRFIEVLQSLTDLCAVEKTTTYEALKIKHKLSSAQLRKVLKRIDDFTCKSGLPAYAVLVKHGDTGRVPAEILRRYLLDNTPDERRLRESEFQQNCYDTEVLAKEDLLSVIEKYFIDGGLLYI